MRKGALCGWLALLVLVLGGCARMADAAPRCTVVIEEHAQVRLRSQVWDVERGSDLVLTLSVPEDMRVSDVIYDRYELSPCLGVRNGYADYRLTLRCVRYPSLVRLTLAPLRQTVYHTQEGSVTVTEESQRLRINTLPWSEGCKRPGFLAVGWNTEEDGSGEAIGFGSRYDPGGRSSTGLYVHWLPCTPESAFTVREEGGGAVIEGCDAQGDLVIPQTLAGLPVRAIAAGAFGDVRADTVAFPPTLERVEENAFASLEAERLYLFDTLEDVSDASFGALSVAHLHIAAARAPVYCGSYFDTLSEKIDYLYTLRDERKLLLLCGSSARFGYVSGMLEAAFPAYRVVNLGVYAYANMLPQARLALLYARRGDVLLSSPELDAIPEQFCGLDSLGADTFKMMESNYDMLSLLDLRAFTHVMDDFAAYQRARRGMSARSYLDVPARYTEEGEASPEPAYNRSGDYILHRENNVERRLFGVKRASYAAAAISPGDWEGINRVYDAFAEKGVKVCFTFSPRSSRSVTPSSTPEAVAELDRQVRQRLHAAVISRAEDSLMDAYYFYGTDNHLSSEGAELFTRRVIEELRSVLEGL